MKEFSKKGIYFLPLGGADEIGMNMYVYAVDGKMIVVDCGYGFLLDEYPGMELAYASPDFLDDYRENIVGLFITHGHEDHLGAIAQIWPHLQCPVYGTDFTLGLVKSRLEEFKMADTVPLISVNKNRHISLPEFEVEFISIAHSVPQTSALAIRTKYGNILHATDWRFDDEALSMLHTDFEALKNFADEGVSMLVCDSTNVMVEQKAPSESDVRENLYKLIPQIEGGLIVTCFASNLMRLESLIMAADKAGRTPILLGRTLVENVKIAQECGYLQNVPAVHTIDDAKEIPSDKAMYICTGSQANYRSALSNIANGENKYVKPGKGDTVIFSSKMIPGNEDKIERMQDKFSEMGATVITDETDLVHTSGHANRDDLKKMYGLLKPAIVLPVHGNKKFIREHKRFALSCGIKEVFSAQNGDMCLLSENHISLLENVGFDIIGWDRNRPVSLGSQLIKNRRRIAYNCTLFISAVIKEKKLLDLQMSSIDILEENEWNKLAAEILHIVWKLVEEKLQSESNRGKIEEFIRGQIRRRVFARTDIKPVTFLHLTVLDGETQEGDFDE
ncbi:MAG: ribonuclease J [Alphaproteobacteria bacterium]|nr:ribonuclease J [Alphaproteobacteria bacterium]